MRDGILALRAAVRDPDRGVGPGPVMDRREDGPVRVRWFGESEAVEGDQSVAEVLAAAMGRWFASNHSPDAFVLSVVIERDGAQMTDEEADAYIRDRLAVKRASRELRARA